MQSPRYSVSCSSLEGLDGKGNESNGCFSSAAVPQVMPDYRLPSLPCLTPFISASARQFESSVTSWDTNLFFINWEKAIVQDMRQTMNINVLLVPGCLFLCVRGIYCLQKSHSFVSPQIPGHSSLIEARIKIHGNTAIVCLSDDWKSGLLFTAVFLAMCSSVLCISAYFSECKWEELGALHSLKQCVWFCRVMALTCQNTLGFLCNAFWLFVCLLVFFL